MAGKPPVIYLDACIFISMATREERPGDESAQVAGLVGALDRQQIIPVTSALTRTEVLQCTLDEQQKHLLKKLLSPPKVQVKEISSPILDLAGEIREYYQEQKIVGRSNLPTLETPDAIHVATAIQFDCEMMFTFDEKDRATGKLPKRGLIPLSGMIAGRYPLVIRKPFVAQLGFPV
ncbi:type II toxin-antitoxin system VapC family toxin [Rubellimicrobium aerolatum]|uniref:Type II toxin-antitoxin system VapC family toxin n=1 Tax=Rubellimicrobium aerolatum TaxID=490979 RepID=A0ABW0S8Q1_9RHOB|nr:PIN domain-containing protein [Rubellimicrobium aerolatum]MBP1804679.1 putative nucleic acid-binding protein [Rubellimicrobium aerolatum]